MSEKSNEKLRNIFEEILKDRKLDNNKYGIDESKTNTNLISKHYSPLSIFKTCYETMDVVVGIIADPNLDELVDITNMVLHKSCNVINYGTVQGLRDVSGVLSETITKYYNSKKANTVEGVGIIIRKGNILISNLYGDFMNHLSCRVEFYELANKLLK